MVAGGNLVDADFSGRSIGAFTSVGSTFTGCSFERARIRQASFGAGKSQSYFQDCSFDGATISMGPAGIVSFENCSFRNVRINDWFGFAVELINCTFSGWLRRSWFNGFVSAQYRPYLSRTRNEIRGNDFSGMTLIDVGFRTGIDLGIQRLPTGPDYTFVPRARTSLSFARREVSEWSDLGPRKIAMLHLEILEAQVAEGQESFLLRAKDYPRSDRGALHRLYELLQSE